MRRVRPRPVWVVVAVLALILAAIAWVGQARKQRGTEPVGLFTTLPILWSESPDLGAALDPAAQPHWAQGVLAGTGPVVPLDTLAGAAGADPLPRLRRLVLAQPRVLSPQENVALDQWVHAGGQLLLLADPALTAESRFALADPRRPQAAALLSPILGRWGLELRFIEEQALGERQREVMGMAVPVNLPGHFVSQGQYNCRLWADGLAVTCAIGKGRVVALADAAVLESADADGARARAFAGLLDSAFAAR
ncbi:MAG: ABC transporter [Novosphingobium sp.]